MSVNIPPQPNPNTQGQIIIPAPQFPNGSLTSLFGIVANTLLFDASQVAFNQLRNGIIAQNIDENILSRSQSPRESDNPVTDNAVNTLVNSSPKTYAPDAVPDGKGGYTPSPNGYWTKRLSAMTGLPVMCPITFVGTTYTALNGSQITIPTITFEMVMISMKKGRNVEKTEITGRDTGSVKEYIGAKDWDIEIRAVITASQNVAANMTNYYQNGKYPEENMEMIDLMLNAPIALRVLCPYMNNRGINYIVIDDGVQINQVEGEYEAQRIVIPCCSDNPLLIQVANSTT